MSRNPEDNSTREVVVTRILKSGTSFGDSGPMIAARSVEEVAPGLDGPVSGFQTAPPDLELVARAEDSDVDESRILSCSSGSSGSSPEWVHVSSPLPNDKQLHTSTETTSSAEPSSIEGPCAVSPNAVLSSTSSSTVFFPPSSSSGFNSSLASAALPAPVFVASSSDAAAALALESVRVASSPGPSAAAAATPASNVGSVSTPIFAASSSVSSVEELKQKHIVATPVQAKQEALQHAKAADHLQMALANRPSVEELKQKHIVATPVQAKQMAEAKAAGETKAAGDANAAGEGKAAQWLLFAIFVLGFVCGMFLLGPSITGVISRAMLFQHVFFTF